MPERLRYPRVAPKAYHALSELSKYVSNCGLEESLLNLVNLRASQINGCAFCLDMHWKDARVAGETEQRLYGLNAWRETSYYTERERAALSLTEAVTRIADSHVPDELYDDVKSHFSEEELVNLTLAITTINSWNRLVLTFRTEPGSYQPPKHH
jgi:AhpD family alkylhydroperoxidase